MKKTFLWGILEQLSDKELLEFEKFVSHPLFNLRKDLVILYEFLMPFLLKGKSTPIKKDVFHNVFDGTYNDQKFRLAVSRLNKILEKFLIIKETDSVPFLNDKLLITAFRHRKLDRHFQKTIKQVQNTIENQSLRNPDYFHSQYYFEYQKYQFISEKGSKDLNLNEIDTHINHNFMAIKLRQASFALSHQAVSSKHYEIPFLEQIMELAQTKPYSEIPAISVYYHFIQLLQSDDADFDAFKHNLFNHIDKFTHEEFRDTYLAALNFCIRKINQNQKQYFHEALDLYKKGLELGLLIKNGKLSRFTYNNIVGIALRIDHPEWVDYFINHYKDFLESPFDITAYSLNMARLDFVRKNYTEALAHLQNADYKDLLNNMNAKMLQAKIYYELDEFEILDSLLKSMRVFIRRKRKVGYHYQLWKNMIRYTEKLIRVNRYDRKAVSRLMVQVREEKLLSEREWLLAKLG